MKKTVWVMSAFITIMHSFSTGADAFTGARVLGMGGAYAALTDGVGAYPNPAVLAADDGKGLHASFPVMGSRDTSLVYSDAGKGRVSGALILYRDNPETREGMARSVASYSIATHFKGGLNAGLTFRHETVTGGSGFGNISGKGFGVDLGVHARPFPGLDLGLVLQDATMTRLIWNNGSSERYGVNIRPGFAWRVDDTTLVSGEAYNIGGGLLPFAAAEGPEIRAGLEKALPFTRGKEVNGGEVAVRIGASKGFKGAGDGLSAGVGIAVPYGNPGTRLMIDYALVVGGSAMNHLFGLSTRF